MFVGDGLSGSLDMFNNNIGSFMRMNAQVVLNELILKEIEVGSGAGIAQSYELVQFETIDPKAVLIHPFDIQEDVRLDVHPGKDILNQDAPDNDR